MTGTQGDVFVPPVLFAQPWWLDAVAPGEWSQAIVEKDGRIEATLPYVLRRRRGFVLIGMPPLTPYLGPWLRATPAGDAHRLSEEKRLVTELIEGLPAFDLFEQKLHHSLTNWLPFHWRGFSQTTRYTYLIEDLSNPDAVWAAARKETRYEVRKAQRLLKVRDDLDVEAFLDLNEKTFQRQGQPLPYGRDLVRRLDKACGERGCRRILIAEDAEGVRHAGAYLVWDAQSAYYLMGGADPNLRSSGASSLLIWEAIRFASTVTRAFDFEGSMIEPIERFFRSFGATQTPYFLVTKTNSRLLQMRRDVRSWLRR